METEKNSSLDELLVMFPVSMVSPNITDIYMSVKKLQDVLYSIDFMIAVHLVVVKHHS